MTPGPRTVSALRWNVIALAFAGPAMLAVIIWIIHGLAPSRWCGVQVGAAKVADIQARDCTPILLQLLAVHRDTIWILGGTLGLVIVAIGLAATGMTFRGKAGPAEAAFGHDDTIDQPGAS